MYGESETGSELHPPGKPVSTKNRTEKKFCHATKDKHPKNYITTLFEADYRTIYSQIVDKHGIRLKGRCVYNAQSDGQKG
jgi:hypothetical protein